MDERTDIHFIKIPISQINKLQTDPKFILIMQLSRYINQLMYFHNVYLENDDRTTPAGLRHEHNTILFTCAVLYEALRIIKPLGKEFRSYKTFRNGLAKLSKDPNMNFLKTKVLNKMRNEFIYHVDPKPFGEALKTYNVRRIDFVTTTTGQRGDTYFNLADELVINYIIGDHGSEEAELAYYLEILDKIVKVMTDYIRFATDIIYEYSERKYWKVESRSST